MKGYINSFQSMGAVDGPGIRYVIFMQGCPLRCIYCHNPETWKTGSEPKKPERTKKDSEESFLNHEVEKNEFEYEISEVLDKIVRFKPYFGKNGGVTVSGGEPLMQHEFVAELFKRLKAEGIHTALDTSGHGNIREIQNESLYGLDDFEFANAKQFDIQGTEEVLEYTDLVLCDIKFSSEEDYAKYCKGSLQTVMEFLKITESFDIPLWIRHVVVPRINDDVEKIKTIEKISKSFKNFQKLQLLPFKKLCTSKYENMGIDFPLKDNEECSEKLILELYSKLL